MKKIQKQSSGGIGLQLYQIETPAKILKIVISRTPLAWATASLDTNIHTIIYCIRRVVFKKKRIFRKSVCFLINCHSVNICLLAICTSFSKGRYSFLEILSRNLELLGIIDFLCL